MIADLIVLDSKGQDLVVVEAKGTILDAEMVWKFFVYLEAEAPSIPYLMLVDLAKIRVKKQGHEARPETYCELDTQDILGHYEPEFRTTRIYHDYLVTLTQVWLRDLAYHWRSETPPGSEQLTEIGLLQRLEKGATKREVPLGEDALR